MKITTKINLLITAWLLLILLVVNTIVYFSFMKTTVNMEEQVVIQKAHDILKTNGVANSFVLHEGLLQSYMPGHSFIRIIDRSSTVIDQVTNDKQMLSKIKPKFTEREESEVKPFSEHQNLVIRVPIRSNNKIAGTLEIGERLAGLEIRKDILLSVMTIVTGISVILSLLAGRWLSNIIMKPISSMISIMEEIELSGVPKKILMKKESNDELQKLVSTFNRMITKLQDNIERQRQFVSDASHEIKTPLTVIISFANLLRRHGIKDEKLTKDAIESIHSEANRMQHLTKSMLHLAGSENLDDVKMQPVDVGALCKSIEHQLQSVYHREIVLHEIAPKLLIKGNEQKIKQVIIILLDNAIKYSNDKIDLFIERNEKMAILRIKDYGIGIPEAELHNIFERFYRVDQARSRKTGGTGLGLPIAKNIVRIHNGEIKIQSKENIGTEIEVILPLVDDCDQKQEL